MRNNDPCSQQWREALARFAPYGHVYDGSRFAGSDCIVRDFLGIPPELPMPVTFQHGVPTGYRITFDIDKREPLFLALTEEGAQAAERIKPVLRFPHPWLMLPSMSEKEEVQPQGTLFIALPSGPGNNQRLYEAITSSDFPRPWSMMVKWRGLDQEDFDWWRSRGFHVETAGPPTGPSFYLKQRALIARHERVAIAYMSSIAVFAAAMRKPVVIVPKVEIQWIEDPHWRPLREEAVGATWKTLLGGDAEAAQGEALRLLGAPFLADKQTMRARLLEAVKKIDAPVYFEGISNPVLARVLTAAWKRRVPVLKLLPTPFHAVVRKVLYLTGLNRVQLVTGNEFEHFGLTEGESLRATACRAYQIGRRRGLGEAPRRS